MDLLVDIPLRTRPCPVLKGVVRWIFAELWWEEPELLWGVLLGLDGGEPRRAVVENAGASALSLGTACADDIDDVWPGYNRCGGGRRYF